MCSRAAFAGRLPALLCCLVWGFPAAAQTPMGTAFTYQGRLSDAGLPANGNYDLQFKLFDASAAGTQVGGTVLQASVPVSGGLFSVTLDFGAAFSGSKRFLEVGVRPGGSTDAFTLLGARQELTPSPNAVFSAGVPWTGIIGKPAGFADDTDDAALPTATAPLNVAGLNISLTACADSQIHKTVGSVWVCAADANSGGTVTGVTAGAGLTGGTITTTGSIGLGTVPVASGGTGRTSLATNGILYGQGTGVVGVAAGVAGQVLTGTAGAPAWTASPALNGNLTLVASTDSAGNIMKGTARFIHSYGSFNTFIGENAGNFAMTGIVNTATGASALESDTSGGANTAFGSFALRSNTGGSRNTALGSGALQINTLGDDNIALGKSAGFLTTGSDNIVIGNLGYGEESSTIRIGSSQARAFIAGIRDITPAGPFLLPVVIDSNGQLGTGVGSPGTVTGLATGPGLVGGPITVSGTIGLAPTNLLPIVACANTEIPKWNGSAWACATDTVGGINRGMTYSVSVDVVIDPGTTGGTSASCSDGNDILLSGGYDAATPGLDTYRSLPYPYFANQTWAANARNNGGGPATLTVVALCLSIP